MPPETLTEWYVKRRGARWEIINEVGEVVGVADGLSSAIEEIEDSLNWGQSIVKTRRHRFDDNCQGFVLEVS
jgi:hypothetical protein